MDGSQADNIRSLNRSRCRLLLHRHYNDYTLHGSSFHRAPALASSPGWSSRQVFLCFSGCRSRVVLGDWKATTLIPSFSPHFLLISDENEKLFRDILIKGGNAVDAAIAGIVCLGIVNPQSSGIGGGHFMTIYNKTTGLCSTVDARETAPAAAEEHMFKGNVNGSKIGWKAMGVPGELHGLYTEYKRFGGGLPWKALLQPSIDLLDNGVPVSMGMHVCLRDEAANIKADKGLAKDFVDPKTGEVYKYGDVMHTRKNHRNLLKSLADSADPIDTFYKGWVAKQLVFELNESKEAIMTKEDIANYKSIVRDQSEVIYTDLPNNFRMCGPPPPSSSAVTQSIIKTLSGYQFDQSTSHQLVDGLHKYIEASKFAFAHRSEMGDMAFVNGSLQLARNITSEEYVQTVRNRITDRAQPTEKYGGKFSFQMDKGTTNIAVIDQYGNSVVATSTVNLFFGARVASESTGIIWNSQMDDFSNPDAPNFYGYPPSPANFIKPGKRPMSSISPIVLFNKTDKAVQLAFGGAGGSTIISGVAQIAMRTLYMGWNIKEAMDRPRLHDQLMPNVTQYEGDFPQEYVQLLANRGHVMEKTPVITQATAILRKGNWLTANSDFRKGFESQPAGY
ncbi:hypothetical protein PRIPAC_97779 [Pristionchus pacificus]|uniref:Gamma-glutamyltranspeptidase n=1 Tax=Pristionchus pacificus TaxID=54126 RepID=A0A8R1V508_PRIPA|nr:hypothetical protein PRIPAC_97779 [Pristionchus pacificus]